MMMPCKVPVKWMKNSFIERVCNCSMNENESIEQGLYSATP